MKSITLPFAKLNTKRRRKLADRLLRLGYTLKLTVKADSGRFDRR